MKFICPRIVVDSIEVSRNVEYIHGLMEQPWGQRVIRFYDPDMHTIEVGESILH